MDDTLEKPTALSATAQRPGDDDTSLAQNPDENDTNEEGDDGVLDWAKLLSSSRPVIPKRGEKDFEPRAQAAAAAAAAADEGGSAVDHGEPTVTFAPGTALQQHLLGRAREAMFDALRATRTTSSKNISYGIWYPNLSRTHVTVARGTHFTSVGHSAPRPERASYDDDDGNDLAGVTITSKVQKRLELLPEETIYLVERGSMLCWKALPPGPSTTTLMLEGSVSGAPMSVQQVYSEMIGREGLTLGKLQVYTYLKRLGYVVTRAEPPDPYYPVPSPVVTPQKLSPPSVLQRLWSLLSHVARFVTGRRVFRDWWHPVKLSRWLSHSKNYQFIFRSLRFIIPSGHKTPLHQSQVHKDRIADTPYKIFYNVYKPNTPFKKTAPGKPDFQVVVVDARTTPMPTLHELANLFGQVPEVLPPAPRRKNTNLTQKKAKDSSLTPSSVPPAVPPTPLFRCLPPFIRQWFSPPHGASSTSPSQRPNPFASLKMGKKIIVIAAVDCGNISFFRFGQGCFEEWPMS
ncbi:hypothetical protein AX15_003711 [Amanita polypyramis BW_CC]|nr:hypothetical protein AX15_003711 [Amanita polypyramis BW_CC]